MSLVSRTFRPRCRLTWVRRLESRRGRSVPVTFGLARLGALGCGGRPVPEARGLAIRRRADGSSPVRTHPRTPLLHLSLPPKNVLRRQLSAVLLGSFAADVPPP